MAQVYSTGHVGARHAGGLVCSSGSPASDAYWDIDTSGTTEAVDSGSSVGMTALTDAQLKSGLPAGFDPAVWGQDANINNG